MSVNAHLEPMRLVVRSAAAFVNRQNAGVEFIQGRGSIVDEHTVDVDGKKYTVSAGEKNTRTCSCERLIFLPLSRASRQRLCAVAAFAA